MTAKKKQPMIIISSLKENQNNPRFITGEKFEKLVKSIRDFPQMMELRPIIVDENNVIQGGNMRFKALQELKYKEIPDTWVKQGKDLTPEQWREFVIKDNVGFGEWDWDALANEWDTEELKDWGLDIHNWAAGVDENNMTDEDVDIMEDFDPIGIAKDCQRVVFIFPTKEDAEIYLTKNEIDFVKRNMAWQVNMNTLSI